VDHVLTYLGRYVKRVALSNARILAVSEDTVTFRGRRGPVTLPVHRFLDRFVQHVLPSGFRRAFGSRGRGETLGGVAASFNTGQERT